MDRFSETIPFSSPWVDRNEDGSPVEKEPELHACQSCGAKVEEVVRAEWDADLMVGPCCLIAEPGTEPDDEPVMPEVYARIQKAKTVGEVSEAFHGVQRKEVA